MELKEIRKQLPHGSIRKIAKTVNVSEGTVSKVFNEELESPKNPEILQAAAKLLTEYKEKKRAAIEALEKATSLI